jgi:hypothetical protein
MAKTIWKYPLVGGTTELKIPHEGAVLAVQTQDETPWMWVLVDPDAPLGTRRFRVFGTGQPIDLADEDEYLGWAYIGTFQSPPFVWHVFEDWGAEDSKA